MIDAIKNYLPWLLSAISATSARMLARRISVRSCMVVLGLLRCQR